MSIFGITYNDNSSDRTFGWFDDHPDVNYTTDTTSAIIWTGAFGVPSSTKGLGLFGSAKGGFEIGGGMADSQVGLDGAV